VARDFKVMSTVLVLSDSNLLPNFFYTSRDKYFWIVAPKFVKFNFRLMQLLYQLKTTGSPTKKNIAVGVLGTREHFC